MAKVAEQQRGPVYLPEQLLKSRFRQDASANTDSFKTDPFQIIEHQFRLIAKTLFAPVAEQKGIGHVASISEMN